MFVVIRPKMLGYGFFRTTPEKNRKFSCFHDFGLLSIFTRSPRSLRAILALFPYLHIVVGKKQKILFVRAFRHLKDKFMRKAFFNRQHNLSLWMWTPYQFQIRKIVHALICPLLFLRFSWGNFRLSLRHKNVQSSVIIIYFSFWHL